MHMILRDPEHGRFEAILLSATLQRMRVVVPNHSDAIELELIGSRWVSGLGQSIEIESLTAGDSDAVASVWYSHSCVGAAS
ncbi:MAG: hypothetical protein LAP40_23365 [Acidobacteriia bacterium]|nr:hypothetical protein [Terriglobia bacterium]